MCIIYTMPGSDRYEYFVLHTIRDTAVVVVAATAGVFSDTSFTDDPLVERTINYYAEIEK